MANEQELFGMPQIIINFRTKGTTAIKRSARGIVAMILHNETKDEIHNYTIRDVSDIPDTGLTDENVDLIKKCLFGTPLRILVYTLPNTNVDGATKTQANVLKMLTNIKWNWLCAPTASVQEQQDLASWIKAQRDNKHKTFKAVLSGQAADHEASLTSAQTTSKYRPIQTASAIRSIRRTRHCSIRPVSPAFWLAWLWTAVPRTSS